MAREYIPEVNTTGSRLGRNDDGVGVDRIDTVSGSAKGIERPRKGISGYMTDGRGNVRVRVAYEQDERGIVSGRERIDYRAAGSDRWDVLTPFGGEEIQPMAIDAGANALYALEEAERTAGAVPHPPHQPANQRIGRFASSRGHRRRDPRQPRWPGGRLQLRR